MGEDGDMFGADWLNDPNVWGGMSPEQGVLSGGGKLGVGDWWGLEPGYEGEQSWSGWKPEAPTAAWDSAPAPANWGPTPANWVGGAPNSYTPGTGNYGGKSSMPMWGADQPANLRLSGGGGGGPSYGGGGPRGLAAQPPQTIAMGAPERTMYDLYTGMLKNPEQLASNPLYSFLQKRGEDAMRRTLAARRLTNSGKALNDTMELGSGIAADFANRMLPQYAGGAQQEFQRFMGPSGLLPSYAGANNAAIGQAGAAQGAQDMMPFYQQMIARLTGGGAPSYSPPPMPTGPSFGGVRGGYDLPAPRLEQAMNPGGWDNTDPGNWEYMDQLLGENYA